MEKNRTIEKVILIISCLLFVFSIVPISKQLIVFGIVTSSILLIMSIVLQIKEKSKIKFIAILINSCSLITDIVFLMYIIYMI